MSRAIELRKTGRDLEALSLFQSEWVKTGSTYALAQVALAEQALGRWLEAHEHLSRALRRRDDAWVVTHEETLSHALAEIESKLGTLDVICNVAGAEVRYGGRVLGKTPLAAPLLVPAGRGALEVHARGHFEVVRQVEVDAGALSRVEVSLVPDTVPEEPRTTRAREPEPATSSVLLYSSLGLSGLGLAAGVTGAVVRAVNLEVWNDDARCDRQVGPSRASECPERDRAWRTGQSIAIAGLATSVVFGGLSLYLWLDRDDEVTGMALACAAAVADVRCGVRF
jgi:PEGA domain